MSSPQQLVLCHYRYDPLDRISGHTLAASAPFQRFYCKTRLATEIDGAISRSIVQHGDQLLAQSENSGTARQATLLATDQQRSVLHAVASSGQHPLAYAPYGHRPASNGLLSLLGFNGERPDPVTGHYLLGNGYRAFNPVLMRFNSPDNLSPFGEGGLISYTYCLGDPINQNDQTGHFSQSITKSLMAWLGRAKARTNPIPKRVLSPKATAQLVEWRRPGNSMSPPANRDISSLKAITINSLSPQEILPHTKTSRALRNIWNTTDPYKFNTYQDLKKMEIDPFLLLPDQPNLFLLKNDTYKVQAISRFNSVKKDFSYIHSKIQKSEKLFTPSTIKTIDKEMETIRQNFSQLPLNH
jgi:RHS repeat-associated protein